MAPLPERFDCSAWGRTFRRRAPAGSEIDAAALALPVPVAGGLGPLGAADLPGRGGGGGRRRRGLVLAGHRRHRGHGRHRLDGRFVDDFGHFTPNRRRRAAQRRPFPGFITRTVAEIAVAINPGRSGGVLKLPAETPLNDISSCRAPAMRPNRWKSGTVLPCRCPDAGADAPSSPATAGKDAHP